MNDDKGNATAHRVWALVASLLLAGCSICTVDLPTLNALHQRDAGTTTTVATQPEEAGCYFRF